MDLNRYVVEDENGQQVGDYIYAEDVYLAVEQFVAGDNVAPEKDYHIDRAHDTAYNGVFFIKPWPED